MLVARQQQVETEHQDKKHQFLAANADGGQSLQQPLTGAQQDLQRGEQDESGDSQGTDCFVFVVAVGMIPIRLRVGQAVGDQAGEA